MPPARRSKEVEGDTPAGPIQGTPTATIPTLSQGDDLAVAFSCHVQPFPVVFPDMTSATANSDLSPVTRWRRRRRRQGFVRVEVQVRKEDAALVRDIAGALGDPAREAGTRAKLRETLASPRAGGLKALLARAPLEGIDLGRPRDVERDITL